MGNAGPANWIVRTRSTYSTTARAICNCRASATTRLLRFSETYSQKTVNANKLLLSGPCLASVSARTFKPCLPGPNFLSMSQWHLTRS